MENDSTKIKFTGANGILLLVNGKDTRFRPELVQMMREMQALFSEDFWDYTIIGGQSLLLQVPYSILLYYPE